MIIKQTEEEWKIYFVRHASLISVHSVEEREGGSIIQTDRQVGEGG